MDKALNQYFLTEGKQLLSFLEIRKVEVMVIMDPFSSFDPNPKPQSNHSPLLLAA